MPRTSKLNKRQPVRSARRFVQMVPFRPRDGKVPSGDDAQREYRRTLVSELILAGLTNREIRDRLHEEADALTEEYGGVWDFLRVSHVTVRADRIELMNRAQEMQLDNVEHYRTTWHQRLEKALSAIWDRVVEGDVWAIDRMLKIAEMDGKLFGLLQQPDAPLAIGNAQTRVLLERLVITIQSLGMNPATVISQLTTGLKSHDYAPAQIEAPDPDAVKQLAPVDSAEFIDGD